MSVNEIPTRRDLEHVDLAAKLQVLGAFLSRSLDLLLALWRLHAHVLDGRKRRALRGPNEVYVPGSLLTPSGDIHVC